MFVHKQSGTHQVIVGPSILHMTKEFEDYHFLASQLKIRCEKFESLTAFGSDGEINIANAFVCKLPHAIHLRCKIHLSDNIERKLVSLSFDKNAQRKIVNTIFGQRTDDKFVMALADAKTPEEFDKMLEDLEPKCKEVEISQHPGNPEFFACFKDHLATVMKENVIARVRQSAGLGSPPEFYTQNASECVNSVVKRNAGGKKEWSHFCLSLEDTAKSQQEELQKAVYGMGEYRLSKDFQHLAKKLNQWVEMSAAQRNTHMKRCFVADLDTIGKADDAIVHSVLSEDTRGKLSIGYDECSISTLSRTNLRKIWSSASLILSQVQGVFHVPWDKSGTQRLVFDGENCPPCPVQVKDAGIIHCSCPKFKSAKICSHSLAVAEDEFCLREFLAVVCKNRKEPDPYALVEGNLPKSSGKKPSSTKRKGKSNEKRVPLMEIQPDPSTQQQTKSVHNESLAVSALLSLSNATRLHHDDDTFGLKHLEGTQVRMCYGCGQAVRIPPAVPAPPHDVCIVKKEFRSYRAPHGSLKVSNVPQNCHYHLKRSCVERKHPEFLPSALKVPALLQPKMNTFHQDWIRKEFGIMLLI
ncbi:uncharacterized protein LOC114526581 [Dendronephthya gigantea]|uniref:uncharacterized protein LOC114526581 n=1 Tax=Dendronephthya gigantea TaxID=151771 RepID=UPI00106994E2|nr:uncharacterized protein LOC114526581 [Dendronephthya gigantea]